MNDLTPIVSIVIPTYNRAHLLAETLHSIQNQTYQNWECIIVDDFSEDNTTAIVSAFIDKDPRFNYLVNQRAKGAQGARNTGWKKAKSPYILFFDSDDLMADFCLRQRLAFVNKNKDYELYCFPTGVFKKRLYDSDFAWNYLNKEDGDLIRFIKGDIPWHTSGALWTKPLLEKLNGWDEDLLCSQDWDIHVRALLQKDMRYIKVADDTRNIDTFYRDDYEGVSIARMDHDPEHVQNKFLLIKKTIPSINQLQDKSISLEMARLVYRFTLQSIPLHGFSAGIKFFTASLRKLRFSELFIFLWGGYLYNLQYQHENRGIRRLFNVAPRLYKHQQLKEYNTTHKAAIFN